MQNSSTEKISKEGYRKNKYLGMQAMRKFFIALQQFPVSEQQALIRDIYFNYLRFKSEATNERLLRIEAEDGECFKSSKKS